MVLKRKFDAGEFAVLAEMEPPKGADLEKMIADATRVKGLVDAFVIPEMSNAVMRMSSLGGAMALQAKGMDAVVQFNCRDRNRLALQADLLAAAGCGIGAVMAVKGEDPSYGDHHLAKPVYDLELMDLIDTITTLQKGRDLAGIELTGAPRFIVGAAANFGAEPDAATTMQKQVDAGIGFFVTPPVFDVDSIKPVLETVDRSRTKVIPTVLLLKSLGMARYIERNMKHIHLPAELIKRIQKAPDKAAECVTIAAETVGGLKQAGVSGVMLATLGWEHKLPEVLSQARV